MGRGKLRMELISKPKARLMAFEKRKKSLEKKADELSTLCGVNICMIIYWRKHDNESNEPMIWPRNHEVVASMIDSYKSRSNHDCRDRIYNLSNFFKDQTEKIEEERQKLSKKMKEVKYPKWDEGYDGLSYDEMKEFASMLTARIDAARGRINLIKGSRIHENSALMQPYMVQQQQPLGNYDAQVDMKNQRMVMMNSGTSCSQSSASYGYGFHSHENQVQQQQLLGYYDARVVENPRNLAYYDALESMENQRRRMNSGMRCSQSSAVYGNNGYSSDENQVQNCGFVTNAEPLKCYYVPDVGPVAQNGQRLLMAGALPQVQYAREEDYVQMSGAFPQVQDARGKIMFKGPGFE
ncbi:hypothetical protein BUALT_Bualt14G0123500 [Buddleja alternifolia]|uniref:MADS-box domain-containing protein n=1 Tax=Buddleja alternifolia TaxID=168488 RepID=A0AAV6WSF2_9LAMI|nr:hypothetical protein BUALT_Bualt14G0123500 [Buddleja alternifolia]